MRSQILYQNKIFNKSIYKKKKAIYIDGFSVIVVGILCLTLYVIFDFPTSRMWITLFLFSVILLYVLPIGLLFILYARALTYFVVYSDGISLPLPSPVGLRSVLKHPKFIPFKDIDSVEIINNYFIILHYYDHKGILKHLKTNISLLPVDISKFKKLVESRVEVIETKFKSPLIYSKNWTGFKRNIPERKEME